MKAITKYGHIYNLDSEKMRELFWKIAAKNRIGFVRVEE